MTRVRISRFAFFGFALVMFIASSIAGMEGFDPHGSGDQYPVSANGRMTEPPSLPAHRLVHGSINIDGILNEPDWRSADAATGFSQFEPDRRGKPSEETVFKFMYDDEAVYIGVMCCRSNGTPITSCLSRRDNITSSDLIRVYLCPYNDMVTGYHFRINPDGVKADYYNYGDLYHDVSWDAVWESETHQDDRGWYVEMRIPFSSLRYRETESMTWGFNLFQHIFSCGERTAWSNWDRDQQGFMSRSGTITGITGVPPARQLELLPYSVAGITDPSIPGGSDELDQSGSFGVDVKYGITPDLTLNATIQPDFGQIEADPSVLNLSPYETYYDEKRPFFIEGAQFFWHPDFTMFYSRRIGTGSENSRIRTAAKLTGKTSRDISTAVLVAATDETEDGKMHNLFRSGSNRSYYAIGRFGKQFHNGLHNINVMQTAVLRDEDSFESGSRHGYTTGADFELNFHDRMYQLTGSVVGSVVDEFPDEDSDSTDPDLRFGTGSRFEFEKSSGDWRYALTTRHHTDDLDINDLGYINNPNHFAIQAWVTRVFNADDNEQSMFTNGSLHFRHYRSWIWADREYRYPGDDSTALWSYNRGHTLSNQYTFEGNITARDCWGLWCGMVYLTDQTNLDETRFIPGENERGPLMTTPSQFNGWIGYHSDTRKDYYFDVNVEGHHNRVGGEGFDVDVTATWVQNSKMNHSLSFSHDRRREDAQWVGNFENPGNGIGDVSYVFAGLDQRTWDITLRTSMLFTRDMSLELYAQPFLTVGDYTNPRELVTPDSYEFAPFEDYDVSDNDFSYGAVNLNMVYRWEYAPGSTVYLVWTHSRDRFDFRGDPGRSGSFDNDFGTDPLFRNEPENRFMVKVNYWIPL